jgi:hypothetical protein
MAVSTTQPTGETERVRREPSDPCERGVPEGPEHRPSVR